MTKDIAFTKRVVCSGRGFLSWIPKNVVDFLSLDVSSYVQVKIKKLAESDDCVELMFVKRVAKSGRGYLLWIPKDVSDYIGIDDKTFCEFRITLLQENKGSTKRRKKRRISRERNRR